MKKFLLVFLFLCINIYGQDSTKNFVSTIGSKIFLSENSNFFSKYGVIKIDNLDAKNKFIEILQRNVLYEKINHKMMVNVLLTQLENRDYSKETLFLTYSPATLNVSLSQPYYFITEPSKLIFDIKENEKAEKDVYSSIRVYLLNDDKTEFKKFVLNDSLKTELLIEEL